MNASQQRDDERRTGDALDAIIDEAVESALGVAPADLRARVLTRLEEPAAERPRRTRWILQPALLPVAGAILLAVGLAVTWRHVDGQLQSGATPAVTTASSVTTVPSAAARPAAAVPIPPAAAAAAPVSRRHAPPRVTGARIVAASWLEMDARSRPASGEPDVVVETEELGPSFPGAPAGNLGDPIQPMPRLRLIVIPPIVAVPIVDAPPVSTLARPVGASPADEGIRDRTRTGNSGGVCP